MTQRTGKWNQMMVVVVVEIVVGFNTTPRRRKN